MLAEPSRTPYDLQFRFLGFPVRIHPLFWLLAALLGAQFLDAGIQFLLIWVGVVFVSIMVHELGHAIAYRAFRVPSSIVLYAFGGLTIPVGGVMGRWNRILVYLAGPAAGFLLWGILYATNSASGWGLENGREVLILYASLVAVNLYWGIFNLIPVFPLDGGQVCRELCDGRWRGRGLRISLQISVWVAGVVAIYSLLCELEMRSGNKVVLHALPWWFPIGTLYTAILFAILGVQSCQLLQQLGRGYYEAPDDRVPWER